MATIAKQIGTTGNDQLLGTAGRDFLWGGDGNDDLDGGADRDVLYGGDGRDKLEGGDGDDVLDGGDSHDRLYGGDGNDVLVGGTGHDKLYGGDGNDVLVLDGEGNAWGGPGADILIGVGSGYWRNVMYGRSGAGVGVTVNLATGRGQGGEAEGDTISGFRGIVGSQYDDTLTGDEGDNYFRSNGGADVLDGGGGIDTAAFNSSLREVEGVTVDLGGPQDSEGYVLGTGGVAEGDRLKNIENLNGTWGDDKLTGDEKANRLSGWGGGDDVLEGRGGADTLRGGAGNDTASYQSSPGSESGEGVTVNLGGSRDANGYVIGHTGGHAVGDKLHGIENLRGSAHADTLTGDGGDNILEGGAGGDALDGGAGDGDTASYADSNEDVTVNLGGSRDANSYVIGHTGGHAAGDKLKNIENLRGSAHKDTLTGDSGDNVLEGGAEADTLNGGGTGDSDTASYAHSAGGVTVNLTLTTQALDNSDATGDTLTNIENLRGSAHNDTLTGNGIANVLEGGDGDDTLTGGGGADTLDGGAGADSLTGGTGADTFVFGQDGVVPNPTTDAAREAETDTVEDFTQSEGDKLDFRGLKEHSLFRGGERLSFLATEGAAFTNVKGQVRYEQNEDKDETYVQVDLDGNGAADFQVTLDDSLTLTNADLLLA